MGSCLSRIPCREAPGTTSRASRRSKAGATIVQHDVSSTTRVPAGVPAHAELLPLLNEGAAADDFVVPGRIPYSSAPLPKSKIEGTTPATPNLPLTSAIQGVSANNMLPSVQHVGHVQVRRTEPARPTIDSMVRTANAPEDTTVPVPAAKRVLAPSLPAVDGKNLPAERKRILEAGLPDNAVPRERDWRMWGPYTSDRQWGTVREDYSPKGAAWDWFSHDDARSRAYRWGEDALLGYSDKLQLLNFSLAMWNGKDPIVKERLFGLTNTQGPHGEDVKEVYYFNDAVPSSSYLSATYRYPMERFPYEELTYVNENRRRRIYEQKVYEPEYELHETGVFNDDRFWDVTVEYAKNDPTDTSIRITVENCSNATNTIHLLPSLYYRNTWSWHPEHASGNCGTTKLPHVPLMRLDHALASPGPDGAIAIACDATDGLEESMTLLVDGVDSADQALFCSNETNFPHFEGRSICRGLYKRGPTSSYPKDCINNAVVRRDLSLCNPEKVGSKMATKMVMSIPAGECRIVMLRLLPLAKARKLKRDSDKEAGSSKIGPSDTDKNGFFDEVVFTRRKAEADMFYQWINGHVKSEDRSQIQRQAYAGMLWTRQTYIFDVREWLAVGPGDRRAEGARNLDWAHLSLSDVLSVCDGWEYPWFATWDLAFHLIVYAHIDPDFAKHQCTILLRDGVCHPNGSPPAYEWKFSDFNPPLLAWGAHKIFSVEQDVYGIRDTEFLSNSFSRLDRFFSWYLSGADIDGQGLLGKSFLGLDNISIVNRSELPNQVKALYQVDGTAWGGFMAMNLMKIALELEGKEYQDFAVQYYSNAARLAAALNNFDDGTYRPDYDVPELFCPVNEWYYDVIKLADGKNRKLECRTLVGIVPLFAMESIEIAGRSASDFSSQVRRLCDDKHIGGKSQSILASGVELEVAGPDEEVPRGAKDVFGVYMVKPDKLRSILKIILDPHHFFSDYGLRSASKELQRKPYRFDAGEGERIYEYQPAESHGDGKFFGGNSSWRGAIWVPATYMLIEALIKYHHILGDHWKVECPTGSGTMMNLREVALEFARRIVSMFDRRSDGTRPVYGPSGSMYNSTERWRKNILFYEYFHGCDGTGVGASHQTGWTGLVADLISKLAFDETPTLSK